MSLRPLCHSSVFAAALLMSVAAQAAGPQTPAGVPGFLNPKTGVFTAQVVAPTEADLNTLAAATYTGTLVLKFNITIKSGIPADWPIYCTQTVSPIDSGGLFYSDVKTGIATRTGNTATCTAAVYYSWILASASTPVTTSYDVSTTGVSTSTINRVAVGSVPNVMLPANGGSLTRTVAVTL